LRLYSEWETPVPVEVTAVR
jgi:hypothetical protein